MPLILNKILILLVVVLLAATTASLAQDIRLPDIGSPADAVLSKNDEAHIGAAIMRQINASGAVVKDPQVAEYVNDIGHRVAAHASNGEYKFTFFVLDDPTINAFALPGGYIGVHTGLLEATRSEDELAGVLAHEIAHVTQRHIARAVTANKRQSMLSTAIMLGAMIAGALGGIDGHAMQGAVAVAQGTAAQAQINFTRSNEHEADRIGMAALADAGFDPTGMASFFEVISRATSPSSARVPEFLRTHPVSSTRIAEARSRARSYPAVKTDDSTNYGIARARLIVAGYEQPSEAVEFLERQRSDYQTVQWKYALAVAYQADEQYSKALRLFEELANREPEVIAYHIGLAQAQLELEQLDDAETTFEQALELFPRNVPLVVNYAEALLRFGDPEKSHALLLDLFNNTPPTPDQVLLIARAAIAADEIAEAHYYRAEYSFMTGDLIGGINFLRQGLQVPDLKEIQRIRFEARIDFVREFMSEEQIQQLQRSRSIVRSADVRN
jgi:beta-barrel assembly-enhancing protease